MSYELDQSTDNAVLFDDVVVSYSKGMHEVEAGAIANAQARNLLDTRVTQAEGEIDSHSTEITTLTNRVDGNDGDLSGLSSAVDTLDSRVTANDGDITSQGSAITTLDNRVDSAETGVSTNAGAISGLQTHASNVDGELDAQSSQLTELTAGTVVIDLVTPPGEDVSVATKGYTNAQATDALTARVMVNEDGITSQGTALTALENTVNDPATGVSANAAALDALETTVTLNGDTISSHGTAITGIENSINDPQTGLTASAGAIDSLETTVTQNGTDISANATNISQISTTVGDNTAAIQTQATSIDGLSAQWTLKAQTPDPQNPDFVKVSGIGLSSQPADGGGVESSIYLQADTFAVIDPADVTGASSTYPFVISDGKVVLNTLIADEITVNKLDSLSSNTGTLTADLIRTAASPATRMEMGGDDSYPIWVGSGAKTADNAIFYVDDTGASKFAGQVAFSNLTDVPDLGGDGSLVNKSSFEDGGLGGWDAVNGDTAFYVGAVTSQPFSAALTSSVRNLYEVDNEFPVSPGEQFYVSFWSWTNGTTHKVGFGLQFFDKNGNPSWLSVDSPAGHDWREDHGTITAPADAVSARPWYLNDFQGTPGDLSQITNAFIFRDTSSATEKVADWARENHTTLIDGRSIYTGDAYVDTLQIKGNAVTVPMGVYFTNAQTISSDQWFTAASINIPAGTFASNTPVAFTFGGRVYHRVENFINNGFAQLDTDIRIKVNGSVRETFQAGEMTMEFVENSKNVSLFVDISTYSYMQDVLPAGAFFELQYKLYSLGTGDNFRSVEDCFITATGLKR